MKKSVYCILPLSFREYLRKVHFKVAVNTPFSSALGVQFAIDRQPDTNDRIELNCINKYNTLTFKDHGRS